MRKIVFQSIVAIAGACAVAFLIVFSLALFGYFAVTIAPLHNYRLTFDEKAVLDEALTQLHDKMAKGEYESIRAQLVEARISRDANISAMKSAVEKFGYASEFRFFRSSNPEPASKYFEGLEGTV